MSIQSAQIDLFTKLAHSKENILLEGLWDSPKAYLASVLSQKLEKTLLILTASFEEEEQLFLDLNYFLDSDQVINFPAWETLPNEPLPPSPDTTGERYQILEKIQAYKKSDSKPVVIVGSLQAVLQKILTKEKFKELSLNLEVGKTVDFEKIKEKLVSMGYEKNIVARDKGEFAVRGGIIDLFPVSSKDAFRIEFFGDEIEAIRAFDPLSQLSVKKEIHTLSVPPAKEKEFLHEEKALSTILDYLPEDFILLFDDILAIEDRYAAILQTLQSLPDTFLSFEKFLKKVTKQQSIYFSTQSIEELSTIEVLSKDKFYSKNSATPILFDCFQKQLKAHRLFHPFISLKEKGTQFTHMPQEIDQIVPLFEKEGIQMDLISGSEIEEKKFKELSKTGKNSRFLMGYLSSGFAFTDCNHCFFPYTEISSKQKMRRQKQRNSYHSTESQFFDLMPGDLVVHQGNGIGKYLGVKEVQKENQDSLEYLNIEYASDSKLLVPVNQAHLVSKYIGSEQRAPKLDKLGSQRWKNTKEKTERAILGYASELLKLYAQREIKQGFSYGRDSLEMKSFEEDFPFIETEDQLQAIEQVKKDMISTKPMERLICGDVGYGKTEVAMRAAFKAVVDGGKQVAFLAPTTVLAMQHAESFKERMANFPIKIALLSRFQGQKAVKETLKELKEGKIDIVIGTHRIVSKDVQFHDLGLIIIDEEQRFGVKTKEHLKAIKKSVDCLTLSATPIPRTLYMSLIGARDMSTITTPPQDRLPITTLIAESDDQLIRQALLRELNREGQAYVIHNRVESIDLMAAKIKKLLPQAKVLIAHGQMSADLLDQVFHAFKTKEADILVATTIIENGIDIPNANTILIDRADCFGLAGLYQLRGRVGRWNRKAWAYFLVPKKVRLSEIAMKRLKALAKTQGFGGGMKIAMHDLEIRGAGDILGMEQSGHVSSIGFHLYVKLLKKTIKALQGELPATLTETKMEFVMDAKLPSEYISDISLRMDLYQRMGDAVSVNEIDQIWSEIQDRFGKAPEKAHLLYHLSKIRIFASRHGVTLVKIEKLFLTLELKKGSETYREKYLLGSFKTAHHLEVKVIESIKKAIKKR